MVLSPLSTGTFSHDSEAHRSRAGSAVLNRESRREASLRLKQRIETRQDLQ